MCKANTAVVNKGFDMRPVLFLDSGIGGLAYCAFFCERNRREPVVYLADREHFPYGGRTRENLVSVLTSLMELAVKKTNPKIAALACNTATVSALDDLRRAFPGLPFVGTVPAIKPAAQAAKNGIVGVLGTSRTIEEPYISRLAAENGNCVIRGIAAPDLVDFVERRLLYASEDEKRGAAREYMEIFRAEGISAVVLGCTHFLFLAEEFRREAAPDITVFDSVEGICRRVETLLDENNGALRAGNAASGANRMLISGSAPPEDSWRRWAQKFGMGLSLLEDA
jgi:glutamate racemase